MALLFLNERLLGLLLLLLHCGQLLLVLFFEAGHLSEVLSLHLLEGVGGLEHVDLIHHFVLYFLKGGLILGRLFFHLCLELE